jgi:glc operon protein GlcG
MTSQPVKSLFLKSLIIFCFALSLPLIAEANELNLDKAKMIVQAAEKYGNSRGWKLSIAVVNAEGNLVMFQRGDGAYTGSIASAISKAKSANAFQRPTSAFTQGVKEGRLGILSSPDIVAIEGGVPIMMMGKHAGAIGISGAKATEDEEAGLAAVKVTSQISKHDEK